MVQYTSELDFYYYSQSKLKSLWFKGPDSVQLNLYCVILKINTKNMFWPSPTLSQSARLSVQNELLHSLCTLKTTPKTYFLFFSSSAA